MRIIYIFSLLGLTLLSCSSKYKYWDISKFDIKPNALKDNEQIKIIYTSQGPDNNKDLSYFIHLIAVSQITGDTVNLLTTVNNGFDENGDQIFNFLSQDNSIGGLIQSNLSTIEDIKDLESLAKPDVKAIKKVVRDPDFDYLAANNYPSIIGWVGTVSEGTGK